jgi:hypothetical protein
MRLVLFAILVMVPATAFGTDAAPKATGTQAGKKIKFPEKGIAAGVKATIDLLESCHDESLYQFDELKKAERGDHVRLVFAKPITVWVMNEHVKVSELIFRLPINTGVFWVRFGDKVRRYSKYEIQKVNPFEAWLTEAQPAN